MRHGDIQRKGEKSEIQTTGRGIPKTMPACQTKGRGAGGNIPVYYRRVAAGIPIIEVSRRLGHARVSHTLDLYGHAIPSYDERIIEKINQIYG